MASDWPRRPRSSPEILVPFLGLVYTGAILLYVVIEGVFIQGFFLQQPILLVAVLALFAVVYLALAYLVWLRKRWAYPVAMVLGALFIIQFIGQLSASMSGFSSVQEFIEAISAVSALVLVVVYSAVGAWSAWKRSSGGAVRRIPLSSSLALLAVGFVIGASLIGTVAGGDIASIVAKSSNKVDVTIVVGAGNSNNGQFFVPANYTVAVGQTVVWVNKDTATHTVTSTSVPAGAITFNSGDLASGQVFSWTPTIAGTYEYYCSLHPWMKGTIVVTTG